MGRSAADRDRRYVPILTWLPAYDRSFLRLDTIAGLAHADPMDTSLT